MATQDPELRKNFTGLPDHVVNFFVFIADEVREIMAEMGIKNFNDLIGRRDLLNLNSANEHWKANSLNLSKLIVTMNVDPQTCLYNSEKQDHQLHKALDNILIEQSIESINDKKKV